MNDDDLDLGDVCPPACTETKYTASLSSVPKKNSKGESYINVFFKESSIVKFKRANYYDFTDIICKYHILP